MAIAKIKQLLNQEQIEVTSSDLPTEDTEQISFAKDVKDFIGCLEGLPSDLSTNKSYMEGFGL